MLKKIFVLVFVLSLVISPVFVFAENSKSISSSNYSEEELVGLIAKLQKQLEEVRKNKVQCILPEVDLSIGDGEGDNLRDYVKSLQNFLKEKGFYSSNATGYFGKITKASLLNYQKSLGLSQSGELDSSTRSLVKTLKCKKDYYFKNEVKEEKKEEKKEENKNTGSVSSINATGNGKYINWSTTGYSKSGFKIVWSKNTNPTYPTREGDKYIYLTESNASSTTLEAFNGSGTYYVRVCEYLGGACGIYSNQIEVSL